MTGPLATALRIQRTLDELAAVKDRRAEDVEAEVRLAERLRDTLEGVLDATVEYVARHGVPADDALARQAMGDLADAELDLVLILADELADEVADTVADVEAKVAELRAVKRLADEQRPFGMDRMLFDTAARLGGRMLTRFTSRTLDTLVAGAALDLGADLLRARLAEMLDGELTQLSRHALGDVRNEATVAAERQLGVEFHRWVSAGDERTRPAHDIDGEIARVGEPFSNGWKRPGGLGCRCRLEPVVDQIAA